MYKTTLLFFFCLFLINPLFSQAKLPTQEVIDFHKNRREALKAKLPANSVAVVFANPTRNRANDVDYVYHQDPNFFYLSGWREPHAVLLLFSNLQVDAKGQYNELLYLQERDPRAEMWNGYRLGLEGAKAMGFDRVKLRQDFVNTPPDFSDFDQVFIFDFKEKMLK